MLLALGRREVREIYNRGKRKGCFEVLTAPEEKEVRSGVHNLYLLSWLTTKNPEPPQYGS